MQDPIKCYQDYFKCDRRYRFPSRIILELTNHCNLSCVMCPRRYSSAKEGFINYELFTKVIDEISLHSEAALIPFFRGESLLHPDFITMMKYVKSKKISPIQLATNGNLLNEEMSSNILKAGVDFISFSLDSPNKEIYARMRSGGNYDKVTKNIEAFLSKKAKMKSGLPQVQVSMVETFDTRELVSDFVSRWIGKVDRVRIYKEHSSGGDFGCAKGIDIVISGGRRPCLKPITEIAICWDGNVSLCCYDWDRKEVMGNIAKDSIENIWHNRKYQELRKMHFDGRGGTDISCRKCDQWKAYYLPDGIIGQLYTKSYGTVNAFGE